MSKDVYLPNPRAEHEALTNLATFKKLVQKTRKYCSTREDFDLITSDPTGYALKQVQETKPELAKLELKVEKIAELAGIPTDAYIKLAYELAQYPQLWPYVKKDLTLDEDKAKAQLIKDSQLVLKGEKAELYREAEKLLDAVNTFNQYLTEKGKPNFPWGQLLVQKGSKYELNPQPILIYR